MRLSNLRIFTWSLIISCLSMTPSLSAAQSDIFDSDDPEKMPFSVPSGEIQSRLNNDSSAEGIILNINKRESELWVDIESIPGETSAAAVLRVLFMLGRLSEANYDKLVLSDQGQGIYYIEGARIREIGRQFVWGEEGKGQNPIVLIRRFVDNLREPSGARAAPEFTGSLLGDTSKAMEFINESFHPKWTLATIDIE